VILDVAPSEHGSPAYIAATRTRQLLAIALPTRLYKTLRTYLSDQNDHIEVTRSD
jgi:hypothetical protein